MYFLVIIVSVLAKQAIFQQPPKIELHPNSIIVNVSDPVTLECRVSGEPKPKVTWLKDGFKIEIDHLKSKYTLIHGSNLFIFAATLGRHNKSDSGVYQCIAENEYGIAASHNATLMITFLKDDFRDMPKSRQVKSGTEVVMECKAPKGHPEPTIYWIKNNQILQPNVNVLYPNGSLQIPSAGLSDNGEYICVAKNDAGYKQTPPAYLNVFEKPNIILNPQDSQHNFRGKVELKCEATGFPRPQIEWKKDGSYENIPFKSIIQDNSLIIPSIDFKDEGEYTCVATNQLASVEKKFTISVYEKPSFTKHMKNVTIGIESKSLLIECNARGKPSPIIYWAKSAVSQFQSGSISQDDFVILENGNLFIENLSKKYEGIYLCQASNEFGSIEKKTVLYVKQLKLRPPPVILYHPQNQTVPVNTQVNLECVTQSDAFDEKSVIKWFKDNKEIKLVNSLKYRLLTTGELVINMVQKIDSGFYQCSLTNSYSETKSYVSYLNVENPQNQFVEFQRNHLSTVLPSAPTQPVIFKVTINSVTLSWQTGAQNGHLSISNFIIEYYSPEWPLSLPGWTVLIDDIPSNVFSYQINNLSADTYYIFTVRAKNFHGYGPPSPSSDFVRTQFEPVMLYSNKHDLIEKALTGEIIQLNEPAHVLSSTSINVTWKLFKSNYLIQGFFIKYKPVGSNEYLVEDLATNKFGYYVISNLKKFTAYEILVVPYSGSFKGSESNTIQAKTHQDIPSHSPINVNIEILNSHSVSIKWQSPPIDYMNGIIIGYRITCSANHSKHSINLNTNSTTRAIIIRNLLAQMKYCIKIAAYNIAGTGPYTANQCIEMSLNKTSSHKSHIRNIIHQAWFLGLISLILGSLVLLCLLYFVWLFYKRQLLIRKSSSKKYLSNNSTLVSDSRIDKHGNRYKLVANDTNVWLDTMQTDEAKSATSPGPQYAEVYGPANPYATSGIFVNPEHNLYNILSYQQTMPNMVNSSYTIKLLNEPDQKKLLKYLQTQTQSQTNTPKIPLKPLQHRVKSVENSQVAVNMTQKQLINYLTHQYGQQCAKFQQPSIPIVPPPSLPHCMQQWSDPSNSSSLVSNLTSNSTLSRNGSTFTAQQYVNRTKQLNLQQQVQHQDYSSISPEDELAEEFRFINQKQTLENTELNQTDAYLNLESEVNQNSNKKFLFLNQNNLNTNKIYISDEMVTFFLIY